MFVTQAQPISLAAVLVGNTRVPMTRRISFTSSLSFFLSPRTSSVGFLQKDDFNALPWHLLALIAGGNALGLAVHESGLLEDIVDLVFSMLHGEHPWILTIELVSQTMALFCSLPARTLPFGLT